MNFGLYLPLLAGLACCNHFRLPPQARMEQALPSALAMGLATTIMLLCASSLSGLAGPGHDAAGLPPLLWPLLSLAISALLLSLGLHRFAARQTQQLGLGWPWLLTNSLLAGLPLQWLLGPAGSAMQLLAPLLSAALFTLLLVQFATLPQRLQRCALPSWLSGQPALLLCAGIIALALHRLGVCL
ncbi:MAG: hypothetical protein JO338_03140 [Aquitalea sp.]|nr:hypothetical protein [Aquitalea sp.]